MCVYIHIFTTKLILPESNLYVLYIQTHSIMTRLTLQNNGIGVFPHIFLGPAATAYKKLYNSINWGLGSARVSFSRLSSRNEGECHSSTWLTLSWWQFRKNPCARFWAMLPHILPTCWITYWLQGHHLVKPATWTDNTNSTMSSGTILAHISRAHGQC